MRSSNNLNLESGFVSQFNCNELTNTFVVYTDHLLDLSGGVTNISTRSLSEPGKIFHSNFRRFI